MEFLSVCSTISCMEASWTLCAVPDALLGNALGVARLRYCQMVAQDKQLSVCPELLRESSI